jgi:hypothetical protein
MVEETKEETKAEEQESTTEDTGKGDNAEIPEILRQADALNKELEAKIQKIAEENQRMEENQARLALGGVTELGTKPEGKELSPEEYTQKALKGEITEK